MQRDFRVIACAAMACCATLPATAQTSASATGECPIAATKNIGELQALLSRRAVEIIERASASGWKSDAHLRALLVPGAEFDLGSGDVGRPMGTGAAGAHALAADMKADSFRYLSWSGIPMNVEPCGEQKVRVEFIKTGAGELAAVEFTYQAGLLVSAKGWSQWFVAGSLSADSQR
ncbi:hypothetical protein IAG41_02665 [Sphingomonas sp. JC676]|uniref:hypothetical protein n=1 Tax=Sphingomonas sp. JC676 TaxID=2768065 RepID=UPI00165791FE|nr:hypothetical protein [Sphingomonas sp. JC676]MBC9031283.1 hypothetical protein [Sphingomonas sp. JC676]